MDGGGNANVFVAENARGEEVAIKILREESGNGKKAVKRNRKKRIRFKIETEMVVGIQDEIKGVIPIFSYGLPDEKIKKYWYAMPIAIPLEDKLKEVKSLEDKVNCVLELARTLEALHKKDIVHRDIKPKNIYFYNGKYCLGDFGLVDYPEKRNLTSLQEAVGPKATRNTFIVCSGKDEIPIDRFLTEQPLIYKTVKDMTITGIDVIEGDFEGELFDNSIIEGIDWNSYHTNLKLEFRKNASDKRVSIQDALYKILEADKKFNYIIYDHGSGEMADYITIHETDNELVVELYHVKKMGSSSYNNSVGDVYEVSGQAIKSVTWFATKGKLIEKFTSRHNAGHCLVKKGGDFKTMIKELKVSGKVLRGSICIVQPGIKKSKAIPDKIQEVLAATDAYVKKAGKVNRFRIMGSI